jgi:HK97 family phage major capsid protein
VTAEVKQLTEQINKEWNELKAVLQGESKAQIDKFGKTLGDTEAKLVEISTRIGQLEVKAQRPSLEGFQRTVQADAAFEVAVKGLVRGGLDEEKAVERVKAHNAAMAKYLRKGEAAFTAEERKLMTVSDDSTGGFAASPEFDSTILKGVVEISPVRSLVRVRNTGKRSVKMMKRTGTFAAVWVGEIETRSETTGLAYGLEEIPTHEIYAMVDISKQDLEDAEFDLESELRMEFVEQFALAEGVAGITGNAIGKPEGIISNAAIAIDTTGSAAALTYTGLVNVSHNGKENYLPNARFIFNLKTLGKLRLLLDGNDQPLWAPAVAGSAPATILGFPYTIVQGMADVAADSKSVAFGDFKRGYQLVDRVALEIERDPYTQASRGAVRFYARKRLGGQVVLAEAIRILKCAA